MPKSRSKRSAHTRPGPAKPAKRKRSPRWLPLSGLTLILLGIVLILLTYLVPGLPGGNLALFIGFGLMALGLAVLTQWR